MVNLGSSSCLGANTSQVTNFLLFIKANAMITDCWFEDNYVGGFGGAIFTESFTSGQTNLTIESCVFKANSAMQGGAVYVGGTFNTIHNSSFESNLADIGADIYTGQSGLPQLLVTSCSFSGIRKTYSSGIYCNSGQLVISDSMLHNLSPVHL